MAIKELEDFNTLRGVSQNTEDNIINVEVGLVHWDCDVQCICDAIEYLATVGKGNKSLTIQSFNLRGITINANESPVEVYERIRTQYGKRWYFDPMPKEIAEAQEKFEDRMNKNNKNSSESELGAEPGERE